MLSETDRTHDRRSMKPMTRDEAIRDQYESIAADLRLEAAYCCGRKPAQIMERAADAIDELLYSM